MHNYPKVPAEKEHLSDKAAFKGVHKLTIFISMDHYKELKQYCKDLKLNGFSRCSMSAAISEAIINLCFTNSNDFKNGFNSLLFNQEGKKWNSGDKKRITLYLHQEVFQDLLFCDEGFTNRVSVSYSEIVAAALELYLVRTCPFNIVEKIREKLNKLERVFI